MKTCFYLFKKSKKPIKKTKPNKILFGMLVSLLIIIPLSILASTNIVSQLFITTTLDRYYSSEGIELFYTGEGFFYDYLDMLWQYEDCYNTTEDSFGESWGFSKPKKIYECGNVDCQDFSFAVKRLGELYNITCKYYMEQEFSEDLISESHLGIRCLLGENWETLN